MEYWNITYQYSYAPNIGFIRLMVEHGLIGAMLFLGVYISAASDLEYDFFSGIYSGEIFIDSKFIKYVVVLGRLRYSIRFSSISCEHFCRRLYGSK